MSNSNGRKRGIRYRFTTSMLTGALVTLLVYWAGTHGPKQHHHPAAGPASAVAIGAVAFAVAFGLVMFVIWSAAAMWRRAGERRRAAERERARPAARRRRTAGVR